MTWRRLDLLHLECCDILSALFRNTSSIKTSLQNCSYAEGPRTNAPEAGIHFLASRGHGRDRFVHSNNSFRLFIAPTDNDAGTRCARNISAPRRRHAARNHLRLSTHRTPPQIAGSASRDNLLNSNHSVFPDRVDCHFPHQPSSAATRYAARHAVD